MTYANESVTLYQSNQQTGRPLHIAVTGHCHLGDTATSHFVAHAFDMLLTDIQEVHTGGIVALSGLAEGADTLFAEAALAQGIPLVSCIACTDVFRNFAPGPARERYLMLRSRSYRLHTLPFVERSNMAYMALGRWLVDSSDLLVAAWNGQPAVAEGGTGDVVAYAQRKGRPMIHIHTVRHTIILPNMTTRL